ncbi:hypothetical protein PMAYCL1PPCAC_04847, partial [Pristionchus mayeri]
RVINHRLSGVAGIITVCTFWFFRISAYHGDNITREMNFKIAHVSNGASIFSYTCGKFLIVLHRLFVLTSITTTDTSWSTRKTAILIFLQLSVPLICHSYFGIAPVYCENETYRGIDKTIGSIHKIINGTFYAVFMILGVTLNILAYRKLTKLSTSSITLYKQQRALFFYTATSTATHLLFVVHQFVWSYAFLSQEIELVKFSRSVQPYIYDITAFPDPIILIAFSRPVRAAIRITIFGHSEVQPAVNP